MVQLPLLEQVRGHHLEGLEAEQQRVLVLRGAGVSVAMIAGRESRSEGAVRRQLSRLQDAITLPLGLGHDGGRAGMWVGAHLECCLREGVLGALGAEVDQNLDHNDRVNRDRRA